MRVVGLLKKTEKTVKKGRTSVKAESGGKGAKA